MLLVAPQFISVSPNVGEFLQNGDVRNEVPREFVFQFSPGQVLDANTLGAIHVVGAGHDGGFTPAHVVTDLGTNNAVLLRIGSQRLGANDNGATLTVAVANNNGNGPTVTTDVAGNLTLTLENNAGNPTTAQKLIDFANTNVAAKRLLTVELLSNMASASTDLSTITGSTSALNGAGTASALAGFGVSGLNVLFRANQPGEAGNGISIQINRLDISAASPQPIIKVVGQRIEVTLNDNATAPTTAQTLINAINQNQRASLLVTASRVTGLGTASLRDTADGAVIRLSGADRVLSASVVSNFQTLSALQMQFSARQPGIDGNEISLLFQRANLGAVSPAPTVAVVGKRITVTLNTNGAALTKASDLITALTGDLLANALISTKLISGSGIDDITTIAAGSIVQLGGADAAVNPGFRGLLPSNREVVYRFGNALSDDAYRIEVIGTGSTPLRNTLGEPVDFSATTMTGTDTFLTVGLDLGATVTSVVPQPVLRQQLLSVASVANITDGDTISVSSGTGTTIATFEFNDTAVQAPNTVRSGSSSNVPINFNKTTDAAAQVATLIAAAINGATLSNPDVSATATGSSLTVEGGAFDVRVTLNSKLTTGLSLREGALVQRNNLVNVSFNQENLNGAVAQDVKFYRLVNTQGTLVTSDDVILEPTTVIYDATNHTATLDFTTALPTATYELEVGDSDETNDRLTTAVNVGSVFGTSPFEHVGFIGDAGGALDYDLYRIQVTPGAQVTATVAPSSTLNSTIRLFDAAGFAVDADNNGVTAGAQDQLVFITSALASGTYYVGVSNDINAIYNPRTGASTLAGGSQGSYQLSIVTDDAFSVSDNNSSFTTATTLGVLGSSSQTVLSQIEPQTIALPPPAGGSDEPGHREIPHQSYGSGSGTTPAVPGNLGVVTFYFPSAYGTDSQGNTLFNQITDDQKTRAREIMEMYGALYGFEVAESTTGGLGIVTGDPRAVDPLIPPDAVAGIAGGIALMNARQNFTAQDNQFGGSWMGIALHEIGHTIGLLHSYDVRSIQGNGTQGEDYFPGNVDVVNERRNAPNTGTDIDVYQFVVTETGTLSAEIVAERLPASSLLNSALKLYRKVHAHAEADFVPVNQIGARIQFRTLVAGPAGNATVVQISGADLGAGAGPILVSELNGIVSVQVNTRVGSETTAQQLVDFLNLNSTVVSARLLSGDGSTSLATFAATGVSSTLLNGADPVQVAQNDDYFSNDAFIGLSLEPDTYFVSVSSTGNTDYDPTISDTGFNGTSDGDYQLQLSFATSLSTSLLDTTGQRFDGDANGKSGDSFEFAFRSDNTLIVDKTVVANLTATLTTTTTTVRVSSLIPFPTTAGFQIKIDSEEMTVTGIDTVNRAFTVQRGRNGTTAASHALNASVTRVVATTLTSPILAGDLMIPVANASAFISTAPFIVTLGSERLRVTNVNTTTNVLTVERPVDGTMAAGAATGAVIRELGGTLQNPFGLIRQAVTASKAGDNIRIVGNGGTDNDILTVGDNRPFVLGFSDSGATLEDGSKFEIPRGVVVQFDAGSVVKLQGANIDAGTSAVSLNRSGGAIQVLGTPRQDVFFTTYENDLIGGDSDGVTDGATAGDWGGLVFRQDSDFQADLTGSTLFDAGIFLNSVNHANLSYGGGKVTVNSVQKVFTSLHMVTARPTLSFNTIANGADAAISADPDSFDDSRGRIGPDIHGNLIYDNTTNGLFIRIETLLGQPIQRLTKTARFDDTDITHVITQNLEIVGNPGGPLDGVARPSGRLAVDPGVVVKLGAARIEGLRGNSHLIAEGTAVDPVLFTSILDDRFGSGGTFDVTGNSFTNTDAQAGQWGGLAFNANSRISIDQAYIAYGGGSTPIEGSTDRFNAVEIHHQVNARIANTTFDTNAGGAGGSRNGRAMTTSSTIFVRQAQPILLNNVFLNNAGAIIDINANAMLSEYQRDTGRSTGALADFPQFAGNHGPLVRLNQVAGNTINGMNVRGDVLTTESVWDDTDIVHVVTSEIKVDQHVTYSGIRLQSNVGESLVVKLNGPTAGFTADGIYLDIDDRIGGTVQVIGQPGFPVILTSLRDDTVGASLDPNGFPQTDTDNTVGSVGVPGQWRSLLFTQFSNDRNVKTLVEAESANNGGIEANDNTFTKSEFLGELAPVHVTGPTPADFTADDTNFRSDSDDNRPAGFQVHGFISADDAGDIDIYSFKATAGNEIWIDLDRTRGNALDPVVEVILADGTLIARARYNSTTGVVDLSGLAQPLGKDAYFGGDFYSFNFRDTGFRLTLQGNPGDVGTYFVRVRSNQANAADLDDDGLLKSGLTRGEYQLQIRERQTDEKPGSVVRYADIRFATNGIDVSGLPAHSPLTVENIETTNGNGPGGVSQPLGNLLESDHNVISIGGVLDDRFDSDFAQYSSDYATTILGPSIQVIGGSSGGGKTWTTTFDIDYADGLSRGDTTLLVFDAAGVPILVGRESNIEDDLPATGNSNDLDDLSRGSIGLLDPFIGPVQMPTGNPGDTTNYQTEVISNAFLNNQLNQTYVANPANPLTRLEPVNSTTRIIEDHIGFQGYTSNGVVVDPSNTAGLFDLTDATSLSTYVRSFDLGDVPLYVTSGGSLRTINPLYATNGTTITPNGIALANGESLRDIVMRSDGRLFGYVQISSATASNNNTAGRLIELDPGTGAILSSQTDNIPGGLATVSGANGVFPEITFTDRVGGLTFERTGFNNGAPTYGLYYSVIENGVAGDGFTPSISSKLFRSNPNGDATRDTNNGFGVRGDIQRAGVTYASGTMGVSDGQGGAATIRIEAKAAGTAGNNIKVVVSRGDFGPAVQVGVAPSVLGATITLFIDNNPNATAQQIVDQINQGFAGTMVTAAVTGGGAGTSAVFAGGFPVLGTSGGNNGTFGLLKGNVTGLAFADFDGGQLYGVTDAGEFLSITKGSGASTLIRDFRAIGSLGTVEGFTSLAMGPQNVNGGEFKNTLFALTTTGRLFAFDVNGNGVLAFDSDNETQQIAINPAAPLASDGTFTLTFDDGFQSYTTDPLPHDAPGLVTVNEAVTLETLAYSGTFTLTVVNDHGDITSLLDGIDDIVTTFDIDDVTGLPLSNFIIRVDGEEMLVNTRTGTTLDVVRGVHSTMAVMHLEDATVTEVLSTNVIAPMDILDTDVTIDVVDVTSFPAATPFNIRIDNEDIRVDMVDVPANQFTVTRGINGTLAVGHLDGALVERIETTGAINYDATAAQVENALESLSSIGFGNVTSISGPLVGQGLTSGFAPTLTFGGLLGVDLQDITADTRLLVGDEIQRVAMPSNTVGGTFTLTYLTSTTGPLNFDDSNATIEAALNGLADIIAGDGTGPGSVIVGNGPLPGNAISIQFTGTLSDTDVTPLVVTSNLLQNNERQRINVTGGPTGGTFTVRYNGPVGASGNAVIQWDSTAAATQAQLETIPALAGNVLVTGGNLPGGIQTIEFIGTLGDTNIISLTLQANALTGGAAPAVNLTLLNDGDQLATVTENRVGVVVDVPMSVIDGRLGVSDALVGLPSIFVGDVAVSGGDLPNVPVLVSFTGNYAGIDVNQLLSNSDFLETGYTADVTTIAMIGIGSVDSSTIITTVGNSPGIAFSPLDFNLWHPTTRRGAPDNAGHGINTAYDNSRTPEIESQSLSYDNFGRSQFEADGGASFYFGLEDFVGSGVTPYLAYDESAIDPSSTSFRSQLGILEDNIHRDLTSVNSIIHNDYELPGGAYGSLITDPFDILSNTGTQTATDRPTLYFNYFLDTENSNTPIPDRMMRDSARVFVFVPDPATTDPTDLAQGTWELIATNNTPKGDIGLTELPNFISHSRLANNADPRQRVQELFDDTNNWRQARVDMSDFIGMTNLRLRFDFSTAGTVITPGNTTNDPELATTSSSIPVDNYGSLRDAARGQNNNNEGFFVDDIVLGWSERGEMVTAAVADKTNVNVAPSMAVVTALMLPQELLSGPYQLEIRRGFEYAANKDKMTPDIVVTTTLDTNTRLIPGTVSPDFLVPAATDNFDLGDLVQSTTGFDPLVGWVPNSGTSNTAWSVNSVASAPTTTLVGNILATDNFLFITVADASVFPAAPTEVYIDGELVNVLFVFGNDLFISRGANAVDHNDGATIFYTSGAAQSGTVDDSQLSAMQVTQITSGVTFRYKVTADIGDSFRVYIDELGGVQGPVFQTGSTAGNPLLDADGYLTKTISLEPGIHTIFFAYQKDGADGADVIPNGLEGVTIEDVVFFGLGGAFIRGDRNVERQQGHFQIENNFIRDSSNAGVRVSPGTRDPISNASPLGSAPKFDTLSLEQLAPGITIANNVIAGFGQFGVQFTGDANVFGTATLPATVVPFGKLINNTIYGGAVPSGTGVRVEVNASPTLLNNLIANTTTGVSVDASSALPPADRQTVVSRTFFHGNTTNIVGAIGDPSMIVDPITNPLFVNPGAGNFYLSAGSQAIDRSLGSLADRNNFVSLKSQAEIPNSDAVSPQTDVFGQKRIDDTTQSPSGLGGEVFNDLGAIERADDQGGRVALIVPEDNGSDDLESLETVVHIDAPLFFNQFKVKLTDEGVGIDDSTVTSSQFTLNQTVRINGVTVTRTLIANTDYVFAYNSNTNEIILTSVTLYPQDARYELVVTNAPGVGPQDFAGNPLVGNQQDGTVKFDILVTNGPNDAPTITLPASPAINENTMQAPTSLTFSADDARVIFIDDPDAFIANTQNEVQVTLTAFPLGSTITLPANFASLVTLNIGDGTDDPVVSFTGTIDDINILFVGGTVAADKLTFTPLQNFNSTLGIAQVQITVNDLGNFSAAMPPIEQIVTQNLVITVNPVNSTPTVTAPAVVSTIEDMNFAFTGVGNIVSVADLADGNFGTMQVTARVTNGTLTLSGLTNLNFTFADANGTGTGDGTDDSTLTFRGLIADINAALNGLVYDPNQDFSGSDSLVITFNDLGNTGAGTPLTATSVTNINVVAQNDGPINLFNGTSTFTATALQALERTPYVFNATNGSLLSTTDIDVRESTGVVQITLSATNGTLTLPSNVGLIFTTGNGTANTTMTFTGQIDTVNTVLDGLIFNPNVAFTTADPLLGVFATVTLTTNDQGRTGAGAAQMDSDSVNINVRPVNDPPSITITNVAETISEDVAPGLLFGTATSNPIIVAENILDPAPAADFQLSISATNGTLTLATLAGLTFTYADIYGTGAGDGIDDPTMTFQGSLAEINAALEGLLYVPTLNFNGSDSIVITVNDRNQTGAGGTKVDSKTIAVTVVATNDAPVISAPVATNATENTDRVFSAADATLISFSDIDDPSSNGPGIYLVSLATSVGTVTLSRTTGLTFSDGDGGDDPTMSFTGTISAINAALNGLFYTPVFGQDDGIETLTIDVNDQGNIGGGGGLIDSKTIDITIDGNNDAPVNSVPPDTQLGREDAAFVFNSLNGNLISVDDIDAAASNLRVTLTATNGALTLSTISGLTFGPGDGMADATMTFTGTQLDINSALDGLIFLGTADYTGLATIQIVTNDLGNTGLGGALSDTDSVTLSLSGVNDAPTVSAQQEPILVNEDGSVVLSAGNANRVSFNDVDLLNGQARLTLSVTKGVLTLSRVTGLLFSQGDGTNDSTMTFIGTSRTAINAALDGMIYRPNAGVNGSETLTVTVNDQGSTGDGVLQPMQTTRAIAVSINAVNDAPTLIVPGLQTTSEDLARVFSTSTGNSIQVADVDVNEGTGLMQVVLAVTNGTLALGTTNNVTVTAGANNSSTVTIRGPINELNIALNGLAYRPTAEFSGSATLSISTSDLGNFGSGGIKTAAGNVAITVSSVNDAPVNAVPIAAPSINEDSLITLSGLNAISISDVDAGTGQLQVTLGVTNGTLTLGSLAGLTFTAGDGTADTTMTFKGQLTTLNSALGTLRFQPTANFAGIALLTVASDDQGNSGGNGARTDSDSFNITVNALNDLPVGASDTYSVLRGGLLVTTDVDGTADASATNNGVLANDSDVDSSRSLWTATLVTPPAFHSGAFTLNPNGTFTYSHNGGGATGADSFTYRISDGTATNPTDVTVTINVNDPPIITNPGVLSIDENALSGTQLISGLTASDANGNAITFSIVGGNTGNAFAINSSTGRITVATPGALNFETTPSITLTVQATDNAANPGTSTEAIVINLNDVSEAVTVSSTIWTDAGLTLKLDGSSTLLRIVTSGTDNNAFAEQHVLSKVTSVAMTARNGSSDRLTIDFSNGNPIPAGGVNFNGGSGAGSDTLELTSGPIFETIAHNFASASSGTVTLTSGLTTSLVTYSGLEPITDSLSATNRVFTYGSTADNVTLSDNVAGDGLSRLVSPGTGETIDFVVPTDSLTISLVGGNDRMTVSSIDSAFIGALSLLAGDGDDIVTLANVTSPLAAVVDGGIGNDVLTGGQGRETLIGGAGADILNGGAGNDVLNGGAGSDILTGGTGTNSLNGQGDANDKVVESVSGTVTLTGSFVSGIATGELIWGSSKDILTNTEVVDLVGSSGPDSITMSSWLIGPTFVHAGAGNDTVTGSPARDEIFGEADNDAIAAGEGNDLVLGGTGNDNLQGNGGTDNLNGEDGADVVRGGGGNDTLTGGAGADLLDGQGSSGDILRETISGVVTLSNVELASGTGISAVKDTIAGVEIAQITGSDNADRIDARNWTGSTTIAAGAGNDTILGGKGFDRLFGGLGDDKIAGGDALDQLYGEDGNDSIDGGEGNDAISGGIGNDTIRGAAGNDKLFGDAGDDSMLGSAGNDSMLGGDGADVIVGEDGDDTVRGDAAADRLVGGGNGFARSTADVIASDLSDDFADRDAAFMSGVFMDIV